jgi:hypothetical protein
VIRQLWRIMREWRHRWDIWTSPHIPLSAERRQQLRRTYLED